MFYLSMSDLVLLDEWVAAFAQDDKAQLQRILYKNGMDTDKGIEEQYCTHRNLQKEVVTCVRYVGSERCDQNWIKQGAASLEAYIDSAKDSSLKEELKSLNPRAAKEWEEEREVDCDVPEVYDDMGDCV